MPGDNERAALAAAREEARGDQGSEETPTPLWFYGTIGLVLAGGLLLFALKIDPCLGQRVLWWVNASGSMRSCAFDAKCSINDGSMKHVAVGSGFIWFDGDAPAICQGVKF